MEKLPLVPFSTRSLTSNWGREKHRKAMSMFYHYELAFPLRISERITSNRKAIGILKISNICVRLAAFAKKLLRIFLLAFACRRRRTGKKKSGRECHQKSMVGWFRRKFSSRRQRRRVEGKIAFNVARLATLTHDREPCELMSASSSVCLSEKRRLCTSKGNETRSSA